ncbi:MAG TPA: class I SAM-dependent methyltransferase [Pyrinomonadaceae bacterium]
MRCILCDVVMDDFGRDFNGVQIYRCPRCMLVKAEPVQSGAAEMYDDPEYFSGWGSDKDFDAESHDENLHQLTNQYLDFISAHTTGESLLDVGTGHGLLPLMASKRGYRAEGTDVSRHVCENLPAKIGIPIHHGTIEEIRFEKTYDIITLIHVLEHTESPVSTIKRCVELLNDGGFIVVVVPNYRSLDTRIKDFLSKRNLKGRPFKHLALGHHNYVFSLENLELLGRLSGLDTVYKGTGSASWKQDPFNRLLARMNMATWCYVVYRKAVRDASAQDGRAHAA